MTTISYYYITTALSYLLTAIYGLMWHRRYNINFTLIFVLIPTANTGYLFLAQSEEQHSALMGQQISYIGGCFEPLFLLFAVLGLCKIEVHKAVRGVMITLNTLMFFCVITANNTTFFYKKVRFAKIDGVGTLEKEYGFVHSIFVVSLFVYLWLSFGALIFTYIKRKDVSRRILNLLLLPGILSVASYFSGRFCESFKTLSLIPLSYVLSQIIFLLIIHRVNLYETADTAIDSLMRAGKTAFISVDRRMRFLGGDETASVFFPQLIQLHVDKPISACDELGSAIIHWIKVYSEDKSQNKVQFKFGGRIYLISITHLYDGKKIRGYQLIITDDTESLIAENAKRTMQMQSKLLLGMATMVESRDNSTGGHIRRTSEGVRLLIEEMIKSGKFALSDDFCRSMIKAAPLHDLGKIAVDDAILRKPGRFTPEEYEKMKVHAAEGARIVREILSDNDDTYFRRIAENVAHYHHERWDGSGYPEGLAGESIPLEARIMAVADVFDALVSKRVYKEKMPFDKAEEIIMEGMGKQFDKELEPIFVAACPRLEAYYEGLEE
ncbi:MAG: HD domain-containing protein [Ruminococcus sp.]|nr:HD domain-containing protein [Ruminococcus sp.]